MDSIFLNSGIVKHLHRLLLNFLDRTGLKTIDKYVALSVFSIYYKWKYIQKVMQE